VGSDYKTRNVAAEMADSASVLNWYRQIIRLRRDNLAISEGDYRTVAVTNPDVLAYTRSAKGKTVLVLLNLSAGDQTIALDSKIAPHKLTVLASTGAAAVERTQAQLQGFGVVIAEVE